MGGSPRARRFKRLIPGTGAIIPGGGGGKGETRVHRCPMNVEPPKGSLGIFFMVQLSGSSPPSAQYVRKSR
jgi:hypothetical protein